MLPAREQGRAGKNQKSVMKCQRWWLYSFCVNGALLLVGSPNCWCLSSFSVRNSQLTKKRNRNIGADDLLTFFCGSVRGADST